MLTQMTEADWKIVLVVFRGCLPRRGDKARDDRRFLEARHLFTVQNVSWRRSPQGLPLLLPAPRPRVGSPSRLATRSAQRSRCSFYVLWFRNDLNRPRASGMVSKIRLRNRGAAWEMRLRLTTVNGVLGAPRDN